MNRDQIMQALKNHRLTLARIERLKREIEDIGNKGCTFIGVPMRDALSQLQSPQITDMPRGGGIAKPTENIVFGTMRRKLIFPADVFEKKQTELLHLMRTANAVSIMLTCLSDKEYFIVNMHLIGSRTWPEVGLKYRDEYGGYLSSRRGRDIQLSALEKMEKACPKV